MEQATKVTSAQEILNFVSSDDVGIQSKFTRATIERSCAELYTLRGLTCPVYVIERNNEVFLVHRDRMKNAGG